jgi:hypothetical protein
MTQWITVDSETSFALRSRLPEQTVIELPDHSAMEHALNRGDTVVAVLPCRGLGQAALAVFRWNQVPASEPTPRPPLPRNTRAGGFLGLTDEPVFQEEEHREKKGWWKRFWEE